MKQFLSTLALVFAAYCCSMAQPNPNDLTISGYVYNTNSGAAVSGQSVCLYADTASNPNFYYYDCVTTSANGYYSFYIPNGSVTGPNVGFVVYTWDCQQSQLDTLINNNQGTTNSASHNFYVCTQNTSCDASFSWSATPGASLVQFASNGGNNLTYSWDFGDNSTSQLANPSHSYNGAGPYIVCLTASNGLLGCSATFCDTIYPFQGGNTCQGYFSVYPDTFNIFTQQFYGNANGNVTSWYWDFGDGSYSTSQNPSHTYADSGVYYVCLTINNCNSAYCDTLFIGQNNTPSCYAYFYSSPISNPNGLAGYQFSYQGSVSNTTTYQWSFGDGSSSGAQNPSHYYTSAGPYTVCLTITDGNCSNSYCSTVGGNTGGCQASFTAYDSSGVYYFFSQNLGNAGYWQWDFGDGTTSTQQYPTHQYSSPGYYSVCLSVGDFFNTCSDTYCDTLYVDSLNSNPCQVWFQYYTTPGGGTTFSAYGSGSGSNSAVYTWSFGNGTSGTGSSVSQNLAPGSYTVCVTVSDPATGCQSSYCQNVVVGGNTTFSFCINGQVNLGTPNLPADVAIVYLITYDQQTNMLVAVQATTVDSSGAYGFCQVPAGQYLIKAALTQNSAYYWNFLPTYYGNSLFWNYAQQVNVSANVSGADIWLIAGANQGGPGFIGGDVTQGANKTEGPGDPLADVQIMLLDMNNYPVAYTYSNSQGHFEFANIPYGTYKVWAEVAGLLTTPAIVTIGDLVPSVTDIGILVSDEVTTGIGSAVEAAKLGFGTIFPNPSADNAFIPVSSEANIQLSFMMFDLAGRMVDSKLVNIAAGKTQLALETANLSPGIYTLNIQSADGSLNVSKKLVKTE